MLFLISYSSDLGFFFMDYSFSFISLFFSISFFNAIVLYVLLSLCSLLILTGIHFTYQPYLHLYL